MQLTLGVKTIKSENYFNKYLTITFPKDVVRAANLYKGDKVSVNFDGETVYLKVSDDGYPLIESSNVALCININEKTLQWKLKDVPTAHVEFTVIDDTIALEVPSNFFQKERGFKLLAMRGFASLQKVG